MDDKKKLLVVEDMETWQEYLDELLSQDFNVILAGDYDVALHEIGSIDQYSAVLLDISISDANMRDVQGFELLRLLREKDHQIPVFILTAYPAIIPPEVAKRYYCSILSKDGLNAVSLIKDIEAAILSNRVDPRPHEVSMSKKKLIIVENDPEWHEIYKELLVDYKLTIASTYNAAQKCITENESFDLIIVNVNLLKQIELDRLGLKLLDWLQNQNYPAPRILVTGDRDPNIANWMRDYKIIDIFIKGKFDAQRLLEAVELGLSHKSVQRQKVFISYSHQDRQVFRAFQQNLSALAIEGLIDVWSDDKIKTGTNWKDEIDKAVKTTKVAVLLVSSHFLASPFIKDYELKPFMDAAARNEVMLFCVAVSHSMYRSTVLESIQFANDPQKPLDTLPPPVRRRTIVDICEQIRKAV